MPRPWIVRFRSQPDAKIRLYCLPYAGSGASVYRSWAEVLPPTIEVCAVQPPGRESRFREPAHSDLRLYASSLAEALVHGLRGPFAIFGHSYGAWTAFELTRQLLARGAPQPAHLFVSGRRAPGLPDRLPLLHPLPDPEFQAELNRRYGGIPPEISQDAELMGLLLPGLRADLTAVETYIPEAGPKLGCPLSAFAGSEDGSITQSELEAWRHQTSGPFHVDLLPGDHFFLGPSRDRLLSIMAARL